MGAKTPSGACAALEVRVTHTKSSAWPQTFAASLGLALDCGQDMFQSEERWIKRFDLHVPSQSEILVNCIQASTYFTSTLKLSHGSHTSLRK